MKHEISPKSFIIILIAIIAAFSIGTAVFGSFFKITKKDPTEPAGVVESEEPTKVEPANTAKNEPSAKEPTKKDDTKTEPKVTEPDVPEETVEPSGEEDEPTEEESNDNSETMPTQIADNPPAVQPAQPTVPAWQPTQPAWVNNGNNNGTSQENTGGGHFSLVFVTGDDENRDSTEPVTDKAPETAPSEQTQPAGNTGETAPACDIDTDDIIFDFGN